MSTRPGLATRFSATPVPSALVLVLLVVPWVQPWAPGPLPNTVPWLLSWGCAFVLLVLQRLPSALELAQAWAIAALLSSLIGLVQYFGLADPLSGAVHVPAYLGDAVGNLRQRNQLATHLGMGALAVLWWQRRGLHTGMALAWLVVLAMGLAATSSRTGLLQMLLLPLLCGLWQWQERTRRAPWSWWLTGAVLGAYLLASVALPHLLAWQTGSAVSSALLRMGEMAELGSCGSRITLWSNMLHLIALRPWSGWGWGELKYAHYITDYPGERFCEILGNAHNLPLHLAVELGLPLAGAILLIVLALTLRARPWRPSEPAHGLAWGVLAMIGLHSLLEYPLWYGPFQLAVLYALGLLWPALRQGLARHARSVGLLALAGMGLLAFAGLDYHRMRQIYLPAAQRSVLWRDDPWAHAQRTVFFGSTVQFARLTSTPLTADNAATLLSLSEQQLHYSPEPRVIERLVQSARLLGRDDLAALHTRRLASVYGRPASAAQSDQLMRIDGR